MLIFAPSKTEALVVQWIERRFPKPLIWVRFPVGVQGVKSTKLHGCNFVLLSYKYCNDYNAYYFGKE